MSQIPQRIVCLSAEATDWLWRIGAWESVAGITTYFKQPDGTPSKPRVSGFSSANLNEITKLNPDLIITFSDVQAKLAAELIQRGFPVLATNQRTLAETEATLAMLARIAGCERRGEELLNEFRERLAPVENVKRRPRVYFEEWNDPPISGIAWVSELIERAGGEDIFSELRTRRAAPERVVSAQQICQANPEIIFASWCGKPLKAVEISERHGWNILAAVRKNRICEIPSEDILQPGFRLVYGYEKLKRMIAEKDFH
ncbi:MAG TPA: helical backbone metal receptor [Candidatus Saccharimonadales bacterium]|nr:helical backbone metal receptor [Candidatus Saccharimonadales bacterium]